MTNHIRNIIRSLIFIIHMMTAHSYHYFKFTPGDNDSNKILSGQLTEGINGRTTRAVGADAVINVDGSPTGTGDVTSEHIHMNN